MSWGQKKNKQKNQILFIVYYLMAFLKDLGQEIIRYQFPSNNCSQFHFYDLALRGKCKVSWVNQARADWMTPGAKGKQELMVEQDRFTSTTLNQLPWGKSWSAVTGSHGKASQIRKVNTFINCKGCLKSFILKSWWPQVFSEFEFCLN